MKERNGAVTFKGKPLTLIGDEIRPGKPAPDSLLLADDMSEVRLSSYRGRTVLVLAVPSLDTPVCDRETRRFNQEVAGIDRDVAVLAISMDLPFAQQRWCGAAGVDHVRALSDHRDAAFGAEWGVLIKELRLLARAVFIVDREGIVRYAQVVPEIADEPDYGGALNALREIAREGPASR